MESYNLKHISIPAIVMQMCENLGYNFYLNDPRIDEIFPCDNCGNSLEILYVNSSCDYLGECYKEGGECPRCLLTKYIQDSAGINFMVAEKKQQEHLKRLDFRKIGYDDEHDVCSHLFEEILPRTYLSDDLIVACEIYRAELNEEPIWFSKIAEILKGKMTKAAVSKSLNILTDYGIICGAYGAAADDCYGYIYEINPIHKARVRNLLFYIY